jgi:hypothetical protein
MSKPIARWNAMDPVLVGEVIARTIRLPAVAARAKNLAYRSRAAPVPRYCGSTPTKWMYASSGASAEWNPTRKARIPAASSTTRLVPAKCCRNNLGRSRDSSRASSGVRESPHQRCTQSTIAR